MFESLDKCVNNFLGSDPLGDFYEQDAREARWLETRPICQSCGERIQDEYCYLINGDIYCERCVREARTYTPEED